MNKYDSAEVPVTRGEGDGTGKFTVTVVFAVTCVLVGGMVLDNQRVTLALTCGVGFFSFLVVMVMLVQTGQLASAFRDYQRERTVREQVRWQYEVYLREAPQVAGSEPLLLPETELPQGRFVPARPTPDESVKVDAYAWVLRLFREGVPDPEKVLGPETRSPGQVQAKKPREEVLQYLLALEMVQGGGKGEMLFFRQDIYDTLRKCQQAVKYGIPLRREYGEKLTE